MLRYKVKYVLVLQYSFRLNSTLSFPAIQKTNFKINISIFVI